MKMRGKKVKMCVGNGYDYVRKKIQLRKKQDKLLEIIPFELLDQYRTDGMRRTNHHEQYGRVVEMN